MEATQETPADVPTEAVVDVGRQETRPEADKSHEAAAKLPCTCLTAAREQRSFPGTEEASVET